MKSNIYEKLEKYFDTTIINIAKSLNYHPSNIVILEDNEHKLKQTFPNIYNNLLTCSHNKDSRTIMRYAQDLICSWIFEDYLTLNLKLFGMQIELHGEDKERIILNASSISNNSDYLIKYNGKTAFIELATDFTGYWNKRKICDLRDEKYNHLKNKKVDFSFLLGIDFLNDKFFVIDILNGNNKVNYTNFHFAFKKPVHSIELTDTIFFDFSFESICNQIKSQIDKK